MILRFATSCNYHIACETQALYHTRTQAASMGDVDSMSPSRCNTVTVQRAPCWKHHLGRWPCGSSLLMQGHAYLLSHRFTCLCHGCCVCTVVVKGSLQCHVFCLHLALELRHLRHSQEHLYHQKHPGLNLALTSTVISTLTWLIVQRGTFNNPGCCRTASTFACMCRHTCSLLSVSRDC